MSLILFCEGNPPLTQAHCLVSWRSSDCLAGNLGGFPTQCINVDPTQERGKPLKKTHRHMPHSTALSGNHIVRDCLTLQRPHDEQFVMHRQRDKKDGSERVRPPQLNTVNTVAEVPNAVDHTSAAGSFGSIHVVGPPAGSVRPVAVVVRAVVGTMHRSFAMILG